MLTTLANYFVVVFVFLLCLRRGSRAAICSNRPVIFNFGDSNSDTGGGGVLDGYTGINGGIDGRLFFQEPTGRICDGRLILDFLCESLRSKLLSPYFQVSAPDFSNGVNFALSGSDTLRINFRLTLRFQVDKFLFFHNISLRSKYFQDGDFRSALYLVDIGQNDLFGALDRYPTIDGVMGLIPTVIGNIRKDTQRIYDIGGRFFWVHNTGPLGCLPKLIVNASTSSSLDSHGCVAEFNRVAKEFNAQLSTLCKELRAEMDGSTVVYVDVFSIKLDIIANYSSYGFGEAPWVPCLSSSSPVCPLGSRRVFWDGVHYTEAANAIVAAQIASTNFSTPPLPLNFFCN